MVRTFFAKGSSASTFAWASRRWSLSWRFCFFCLRAVSSLFILFLMDDGWNLAGGILDEDPAREEEEEEVKRRSSVCEAPAGKIKSHGL